MDRGKNLPPGKGSKSKTMGFSGDFIALGSKPGSRPEASDAKGNKPSSSSAPAASSSNVPSKVAASMPSLGMDKKREVAGQLPPTSASLQLGRKPSTSAKPGQPNVGSFMALGRQGPNKPPDPHSPETNIYNREQWEDVAIEVEPADLLSAIGEAEAAEDEIKIEALLCGAVKMLKAGTSGQLPALQRNKVEPVLALVLVYLAKWRPQYYNTELIVEALLSLLKREVVPMIGPYKGRGNTTATASLACNLLLAGCQEERNWSESFLKVFVEDSVGERIWVDREECQGFVDNILTAFGTKVPSRAILQLQHQQEGGVGIGTSGPTNNSPSVVASSLVGEDETSVDSDNSQGGSLLRLGGAGAHQEPQVQVFPRFQEARDVAETLVMDVVNQHLSRRQQPVSDLMTRNFLKLLTSTAGLPAVRLQAAQRLEMWLSNQKLLKPATDLLLSICVNCSVEAPTDNDVINALLRLRLKSKPLLQTYLTCFKELVEHQPDQLPLIIRLIIFNELSPARGPNNMSILSVLVVPWPDRTASILADVFIELLLNREDYLRALRALLRELVRALRQDLPLPIFCYALLQASLHERRSQSIREFEFKDRLMTALADLATLCLFLTISPSVRESAVMVSRGDLREAESFRQFHASASAIQREAILWLHASIPAIFEPARPDYSHCLRKVLFMETGEHYYNKDGWPPEVDRAIMIRLSSEIPVMEDTIAQLLLIGLSKDHPIIAPDALEIADQVIRRCAAAATHYQAQASSASSASGSSPGGMLTAENRELFELLLRLTAYHYPENILLPQGYIPPSLAISSLYWKAWLMLLTLTAHNPASLGSEAWNGFPILRSLMEMCITNDFTSPMGQMDQQELQVAAIERQAILEFETHLAAASTKTVITESNSLLLSQLTSLDPRGPMRRPPPGVIEQLRQLNGTLRLGHLLCRSRSPDFLLEILHRQGAAQSKPWLADLVESNEGAWSLLPVQCLCEFLLHEAAEDLLTAFASSSSTTGGFDLPGMDDPKQAGGKQRNKERRHKHQQLVHHLRLLLTDPLQLPEACREVLDYLMRRLSAQKSVARNQALTALSVVLGSKEEDGMEGGPSSSMQEESQEPYGWLIHQLPTIPHFEAVRSAVVSALRSAILVETKPQAVASYLRFLASTALDEPLQDQADLVLDLSQVIVERSSLVTSLLPSPTNRNPQSAKTLDSCLQLFWQYLRKAREPNKEAYTWSENQDQVLVQWSNGEAASLHILVVHAMIILLTYGPPDQVENGAFGPLLEAWFPLRGEHPQAYLVETSEEALLYPDWLKLRMIRSHVDVMVDTALKELEPGQLILFIQSFGIPVASMSKLLSALDRMVVANSFAFVEVDMDKTYMHQLFQVQWARGARGGTHFADIMQFPPSTIPNEPATTGGSRASVVPKQLGPSLVSRLSQLTVDGSASVLRQLFDIQTVIRLSQPEKMKAYRVLSNTLSSEFRLTSGRPSTEALSIALDGILDAPATTSAMERQTAFSCGLLRLLTSAAATADAGPLKVIVTSICRKISSIPDGQEIPSPLKGIARQFLKSQGVAHQSVSQSSTAQQLDLSSKQLERHMQQVAARALAVNDTRSLVKSIVSNLGRSGKTSNRSTGLLVDWLELLDPEIITALPDIETRLLFGKKTSGPPTCRPYALALLVHQASWTTLRKCIQELLKDSAEDGEDIYEPRVVLDFLAALVKVPKLWQGRDKHVPKHRQSEDLLRLSNSQIFRLADYIVDEQLQLLSTEGLNRTQRVLEERSQLLLSCCGGSRRTEASLARYIQSDGVQSAQKASARRLLLLQLYVRAPHIGARLPITLEEGDEAGRIILQTAVPCAMDSMALTLLSSLASPQPGKDGSRRMADLETALRKMAATHPLLLLRQFSSLGVALRGRAHLDVSVLRSRNHLNLFSSTLGLAQQLAGHLLSAPEHRTALEDMLISFWTLFGNQRLTKDAMIVGLLYRFLHFLLDFVAAAPFAASGCLQKHIPLLQDLQLTHPDMTAITELLSALSRPRPADSEGENHHYLPPGSSTAMVPVVRYSVRLGPILARLRQSDNYEEVVQVLQDLENAVSRAPGGTASSYGAAGLDGAVSDLRPLLCSPNQAVRNVAYTLLLRYLKDNPAASGELLPDFLDCLENKNAAIVTTALERLPDFLLLCQENGDMLLSKAFNLAVESGYNTLTHMSEAVMLLQHQTGT